MQTNQLISGACFIQTLRRDILGREAEQTGRSALNAERIRMYDFAGFDQA